MSSTRGARCDVLDPRLARLDEPVHVTAWLSQTTPEARRFAGATFLEHTARASGGKLVVRVVDPHTEAEKDSTRAAETMGRMQLRAEHSTG